MEVGVVEGDGMIRIGEGEESRWGVGEASKRRVAKTNIYIYIYVFVTSFVTYIYNHYID